MEKDSHVFSTEKSYIFSSYYSVIIQFLKHIIQELLLIIKYEFQFGSDKSQALEILRNTLKGACFLNNLC